jgi:hypothetical protein
LKKGKGKEAGMFFAPFFSFHVKKEERASNLKIPHLSQENLHKKIISFALLSLHQERLSTLQVSNVALDT